MLSTESMVESFSATNWATARMLFASADHRVLMPASMLTGAALLLVCDLIAKLLALPINTITALMGIPVVIFVVIRNRNLF